MDRIKCHNSNSGNIISFCWCDGVLEVEFQGSKKHPTGAVWQYAGVPQEKWQRLLSAPSAGSYLNAEIKPHYAATRIS